MRDIDFNELFGTTPRETQANVTAEVMEGVSLPPDKVVGLGAALAEGLVTQSHLTPVQAIGVCCAATILLAKRSTAALIVSLITLAATAKALQGYVDKAGIKEKLANMESGTPPKDQLN